jgi:CheY-like chemotaxis protein
MMSSRPKVLIIDSDALISLFITNSIQQAGYVADIARTGQDGLAKIKDFRPQCLILDALLPDISGYAICRRVRQSFANREMGILLISSKDAPLDRRYGLRQGADRYLSKPFSAEALLQEVWEITPEAFRSRGLTTISFTPQPPVSSNRWGLIPRRISDQEAMRASSPFVDAVAMKNRYAQRLYSIIDGKKTVIELAVATGLDAKVTFKLLCELLKENYIHVYDASGQLVESTLFLSAL